MTNQTMTVFIAFAIATLGLWMPRVLTVVLLLIAISIGYSFGAFSQTAVLWIVLFAGICALYSSSTGKRKLVFAICMLLLALVLGLHLIPGFERLALVEPVKLSSGASVFTLNFSSDKVIAGLLMTAIVWRRLMLRRGDWIEALEVAWPVITINVLILMLLSVAAGFTRFDPKFSPVFFVWAAHNLLFTCLGEEMCFRGFIQWELMHLLKNNVRGKWLALAISSIAFGAVHFAGGWLYALIACVAGAGYGYVFMRTMRLEMAMLAHFTVNAVHFLLFAYPRSI
jgi:membrane protease YdiL (CAAX protease family)